ncbi:MAG: hypothetical protein HRU02_18655, partial [Myxococcales bacterium]|nr:hypothetical protein [Myxococcales bacterium]
MVRSFLLSLVAGSMGLAIVLSAGTAWAGYKMEIDDTKWISLGIGGRSSFTARQDSAPSGTDWSKDFNLDNARIYIAGQVHEKVSFEFNTECVFCGNSALEEFVVLDAIAKIAVNDYVNIWGGRLLVPAERSEMNGPFYSSTYERFKTPFYPSDQSVNFGTGGAGVYGRDNGVNIWGAAGPDGALQYVFGVFSGLRSATGAGPNQDDGLLYAGRIAYNFLGVENNPGYYTSGTYYGGAGDILTVAFAFQVQNDATGTAAAPDDFFGMSVDVLGEFALGSGVLTLDGEYKHFDTGGAAGGPLGLFDGDSYSVVGLFLLPNQVGIGKLQPYVRYTDIKSSDSSGGPDMDETEVGINYVIDGH